MFSVGRTGFSGVRSVFGRYLKNWRATSGVLEYWNKTLGCTHADSVQGTQLLVVYIIIFWIQMQYVVAPCLFILPWGVFGKGAVMVRNLVLVLGKIECFRLDGLGFSAFGIFSEGIWRIDVRLPEFLSIWRKHWDVFMPDNVQGTQLLVVVTVYRRPIRQSASQRWLHGSLIGLL